MMTKTMVLVAALAGCSGKVEIKTGETTETKPEAESASNESKDTKDSKTEVAAATGGASCEAALDNAFKIVEASDDADLKQILIDNPRPSAVAVCKEQNWTTDLRSCLVAAKTVNDVYHDCYMRPLKGRPLQIKRTFNHESYAENKAADPPMMTQDGDFYQTESGCGILFVDAKPGQALFLTCNGTTRGPLTLPHEVKEAFAVLAADSKARHDMVMSLIASRPSGRFGGWKVCDEAGNCHVE